MLRAIEEFDYEKALEIIRAEGVPWGDGGGDSLFFKVAEMMERQSEMALVLDAILQQCSPSMEPIGANCEGRTLLHFLAAAQPRTAEDEIRTVRLVRTLREKGDIEMTRDNHGRYPLMELVLNRVDYDYALAMLDALLVPTLGAPLPDNFLNSGWRGEPVIIAAARERNLPVCRALEEKGASPVCFGSNGDTISSIAVRLRDLPLLHWHCTVLEKRLPRTSAGLPSAPLLEAFHRATEANLEPRLKGFADTLDPAGLLYLNLFSINHRHLFVAKTKGKDDCPPQLLLRLEHQLALALAAAMRRTHGLQDLADALLRHIFPPFYAPLAARLCREGWLPAPVAGLAGTIARKMNVS
jgi:hypothetical protein